MNEAHVFHEPIVTTLEPLTQFYVAEDYHQDYAARNPEQPYIAYVAQPKVEKLRKNFVRSSTKKLATKRHKKHKKDKEPYESFLCFLCLFVANFFFKTSGTMRRSSSTSWKPAEHS